MAFALVQTSGDTIAPIDNFATAQTVNAWTGASNFVVGNLVIVKVTHYAGTASNTLSCTINGLAATLLARENPSNTTVSALLFYAVVATGGARNVVLTPNAGSDHYISLDIEEYSFSGTLTLVGSAATGADGTSTTPSANTTGSAASGDLAVGLLAMAGANTSTITNTAPSGATLGFNEGDSNAHEAGAGASKILSAGGAQAFSWTVSNSDPWTVLVAVFNQTGGGGSATIACSNGTYTHTGQAVALTRSLRLVCGQTSYAHTGQAVTLRRGYTIQLEQATSTQDESDSGPDLLWGHRLAAEQGNYVHAGQAVGLLYSRRIPLAQSVYTHTGQAVAMTKSNAIACDQSSYAHTGQDIALTKSGALTLLAAQGAYAHTGQDLATRWAHRLVLAFGSYVHTGQDVGLARGVLLALAGGTYAMTGNALNTLINRRIVAEYGAYVLSGRSVSLVYSGDPIPPPVAAAASMGRKFRTRGRR